MAIIHFIMDPQCGWCYAAAPLVDALTKLADTDIQLHAGGLFSARNKGPVSADFRQHMLASDHRIMQLTGQQFSQNYYSKLLADPQRILDSDSPTAALLSADSLGINSITMLHRLQTAQFVDGLCMSDLNNLIQIATELGANSKAFVNAYEFFSGANTEQHIARSGQLLQLIAGNGFPTFAVERSNGGYTKLNHSSYYGRPEQWLAYVKQHV